MDILRRKFSAVFSPVVVRVRNQERARVRLRYGKGVAMKIKVIWTIDVAPRHFS